MCALLRQRLGGGEDLNGRRISLARAATDLGDVGRDLCRAARNLLNIMRDLLRRRLLFLDGHRDHPGDFGNVRQQKTGTELAIPIHATLAAIIAETPANHLDLLDGANRIAQGYCATAC